MLKKLKMLLETSGEVNFRSKPRMKVHISKWISFTNSLITLIMGQCESHSIALGLSAFQRKAFIYSVIIYSLRHVLTLPNIQPRLNCCQSPCHRTRISGISHYPWLYSQLKKQQLFWGKLIFIANTLYFKKQPSGLESRNVLNLWGFP